VIYDLWDTLHFLSFIVCGMQYIEWQFSPPPPNWLTTTELLILYIFSILWNDTVETYPVTIFLFRIFCDCCKQSVKSTLPPAILLKLWITNPGSLKKLFVIKWFRQAFFSFLVKTVLHKIQHFRLKSFNFASFKFFGSFFIFYI
jgi:hypothetical protein